MTSPHQILNPAELGPPSGFSHAVIAAPGKLVFLGGQTAHDSSGSLPEGGVVEQFDAAAGNVLIALKEAGSVGGRPCEHAHICHRYPFVQGIIERVRRGLPETFRRPLPRYLAIRGQGPVRSQRSGRACVYCGYSAVLIPFTSPKGWNVLQKTIHFARCDDVGHVVSWSRARIDPHHHRRRRRSEKESRHQVGLCRPRQSKARSQGCCYNKFRTSKAPCIFMDTNANDGADFAACGLGSGMINLNQQRTGGKLKIIRPNRKTVIYKFRRRAINHPVAYEWHVLHRARTSAPTAIAHPTSVGVGHQL